MKYLIVGCTREEQMKDAAVPHLLTLVSPDGGGAQEIEIRIGKDRVAIRQLHL